MALTSKIKVDVTGTQTNAADLSTPSDAASKNFLLSLATGTGANQADLIFHDQRTTDDTGEELDMAGTLTDKFGATITFARVKAILVFAAAANTLDVQVGGSASNGFNTWVGAAGDLVAVKPGGAFVLATGDATAYAVTASTGDLLKIAASASGNVTYDIVIIGASA